MTDDLKAALSPTGARIVSECQTCIHWKRHKPQDLNKEYDESTLKPVNGLFGVLGFIFDPKEYKLRPNEVELDFIHNPNPKKGWCHWQPRSIITREDYYCGQYKDQNQ